MNFPRVIEQSELTDGHQFVLFIEPEIFFFKGHFDDAPIIPGVAQTYWAIEYGKQVYPQLSTFNVQTLSALKFQQVMQPNEMVTLFLAFNDEKNSLSFSFSSSEHKYSSGKIIFNHG